MVTRKGRVCPVAMAASLDSRLRRWVQNPRKLLGPHVREGMTVLDLGCGPGYFTRDIARMVGQAGRVVAADVQEGMLHKLWDKIQGTEFQGRITLHQCEAGRIGLSEQVDFILAFYMIHEIPNPKALLKEMAATLKPEGRLLIVEPPLHVSKADFEETVENAQTAGFKVVQRPRIFLSKAVILSKG